MHFCLCNRAFATVPARYLMWPKRWNVASGIIRNQGRFVGANRIIQWIIYTYIYIYDSTTPMFLFSYHIRCWPQRPLYSSSTYTALWYVNTCTCTYNYCTLVCHILYCVIIYRSGNGAGLRHVSGKLLGQIYSNIRAGI